VFEAALDVELSGDRDDLRKISAAQDILEAYRDAEIQNAFGDDCIPPLPQLKPNDLRPGEIILYPILLSDRVELIYAIGGESAYHRLPPNTNANRAVVTALIERLRLSLTTLGDDWRPASRALYDILIAPIESRLTPTGLPPVGDPVLMLVHGGC
jgi:CHAT domain-containing protein